MWEGMLYRYSKISYSFFPKPFFLSKSSTTYFIQKALLCRIIITIVKYKLVFSTSRTNFSLHQKE